MTKIAYTGSSDFNILGADDLKKAGVEGFSKTTFAKGETKEVEDGVASALIADPDLFGKFSLVEDEPAQAKEAEAPSTAKKPGPTK